MKMQKLKEWLLRYGSISPWEAIEHIRMTRLAAYIKILKDRGWKIETVIIRDVDPDGYPLTYARYYLRGIKEVVKSEKV